MKLENTMWFIYFNRTTKQCQTQICFDKKKKKKQGGATV